jgi:hypothetical protein
MAPTEPIDMVLREFASACSQSTWNKAQVLIVGTPLTRGCRTVGAALRQMGLSNEPRFSLHHQVLNRAQWSTHDLSRRLLHLLVQSLVADGEEIAFGIDETLEQRWGRHIRTRGYCRNPRASSKQCSMATSGMRWIVLALIIKSPWTQRS